MVGNSGHVLQLPFIDESKAHFEWAAAHNTQTQTFSLNRMIARENILHFFELIFCVYR